MIEDLGVGAEGERLRAYVSGPTFQGVREHGSGCGNRGPASASPPHRIRHRGPCSRRQEAGTMSKFIKLVRIRGSGSGRGDAGARVHGAGHATRP